MEFKITDGNGSLAAILSGEWGTFCPKPVCCRVRFCGMTAASRRNPTKKCAPGTPRGTCSAAEMEINVGKVAIRP